MVQVCYSRLHFGIETFYCRLLRLMAGMDIYIYWTNFSWQVFLYACKKTKQKKNVAFRLYIEKFTRFSLRFNVLLLTLLHAWAKKKDRWTHEQKLTYIFWLSTTILASGRIIDWLIYNRQILAIHAFVWKKNWLLANSSRIVSFAAVTYISVVTQRSFPLRGEESCMTTLITAAKETFQGRHRAKYS